MNTPPINDPKFWLALQSALTALVLTITGIYYPDQLTNVTKIVAAVNGVIAVFIAGYVTPGIIANMIAKAKAKQATKISK